MNSRFSESAHNVYFIVAFYITKLNAQNQSHYIKNKYTSNVLKSHVILCSHNYYVIKDC